MLITDKDELAVLLQAAQTLKLDPEKLQPRNPWELDGSVAKSMQMAVGGLNPAMAARFRQRAGLSINLMTASAEAGVISHTPATQQNLIEHSEVAAKQSEVAAREEEARLEKWLKDQVNWTEEDEKPQQPNSFFAGRMADGVKQMNAYNAAMGVNG